MTGQGQAKLISGSTSNISATSVFVVDLEHALLMPAISGACGEGAAIDPATGCLPEEPGKLVYDETVLAMVRDRRDKGCRTALVSAHGNGRVQAVADHLAVFDDAIDLRSSEIDSGNPKGAGKVDRLLARYGERGFDFVGSQPEDLAVWRRAQRSFAVRPSPQLKADAKAHGINLVVLGSGAGWSILPLVRALRPHQWVKNLLILLPVIASHEFGSLGAVLLAIIAFSLTASSVYILNDIADLESDRAHARKRNRPFASGAARISHGIWLAAILVVAAVGLSLAYLPLQFVALLGLYMSATVAYTYWLKRKLLVDIITLAGLYTTRILAGGAATGIAISPWLLAFSMFVFFSLAAIKRQAELIGQERNGRHGVPGRAYQSDDLPVVRGMAISSGQAAVLVLALYINSPAVTGLYAQANLLWFVCPILFYWLSRMELLTHRGFMHDDPIVFAFRDRISLLCFLAVVTVVIVAVKGY